MPRTAASRLREARSADSGKEVRPTRVDSARWCIQAPGDSRMTSVRACCFGGFCFLTGGVTAGARGARADVARSRCDGEARAPFQPVSAEMLPVPDELLRITSGGLTSEQVGQRAAATSFTVKQGEETLKAAAARVDQSWQAFPPEAPRVRRHLLSRHHEPAVPRNRRRRHGGARHHHDGPGHRRQAQGGPAGAPLDAGLVPPPGDDLGPDQRLLLPHRADARRRDRARRRRRATTSRASVRPRRRTAVSLSIRGCAPVARSLSRSWR